MSRIQGRWFIPQVDKTVRGHLAGNLERGIVVLEDRAKILIGIPGPPRSRPLDPPHVDTGVLIASVDHVTDRALLEAAVGSDVIYAAYLEYGTIYMAPRPWLRRACIEMYIQVARELGAP